MSTTPAHRIYEFNKAVFDVSIDTSKAIAEAVSDGATRAWTTLRDTGCTVVGQARAAVDRTAGDATAGIKQVSGQARAVVDRTAGDATAGIKQVSGQARAAVDRTAGDVTTGAKTVAGQAEAQGERAAGRLDDIAERTARRATDAVDPSPTSGTPYERWTRADLYERAQELDIDGRSTMSKQQLIDALRAS
jgi:hypothetical protein